MKRFYLALVFFGLLVAAGCSSTDEVVGLWVYSVGSGLGETRLELNDDGTGYLRIIALTQKEEGDITWKVEDDELCITLFVDEEHLSNDDFWQCSEYAIEGDRMTYSLFGETFLFERWPDN